VRYRERERERERLPVFREANCLSIALLEKNPFKRRHVGLKPSDELITFFFQLEKTIISISWALQLTEAFLKPIPD